MSHLGPTLRYQISLKNQFWDFRPKSCFWIGFVIFSVFLTTLEGSEQRIHTNSTRRIEGNGSGVLFDKPNDQNPLFRWSKVNSVFWIHWFLKPWSRERCLESWSTSQVSKICVSYTLEWKVDFAFSETWNPGMLSSMACTQHTLLWSGCLCVICGEPSNWILFESYLGLPAGICNPSAAICSYLQLSTMDLQLSDK